MHRLQTAVQYLLLTFAACSLPPIFGQTPAAPIAHPPNPTASTREVATSDSSPDLKRLRSMIDGGQTTEALKQLDAFAVQQPVPAGINRLRGVALYSQNRFAEADAALANALKQDPHDEEATQLRGLALFRLGRAAEAIPLLEAAHNWTPQTRVDPAYVLALCYIDTHNYDNARKAFALQYGFPPDSASAYLLAARMLLRRDYRPIARQFANKAIELDPQLPLAHMLLGEIALADEHVDEAIAEFEKERARNPLEGSVYDRLGDAYIRSGNDVKAQQSLQQALLLEPNSTGPFILLGKVLLKQNDPVNAIPYLERAERMDTSNYITHNLLGRAYHSVGRTEDATREFQTSQKLQAANQPKLETAH